MNGRKVRYKDGVFTDIRDIEDICQDLKALVEDLQDDKQYLQDELNKISSEKWRDEELQTLKEERDSIRQDSYRGFPISEKEMKAIKEWQYNHDVEQHGLLTETDRLRSKGAIGGSYAFDFVGTSIGTFGSCYCSACRSKAIKYCNGDLNSYRRLLKEYDAEFSFQEP